MPTCFTKFSEFEEFLEIATFFLIEDCLLVPTSWKRNKQTNKKYLFASLVIVFRTKFFNSGSIDSIKFDIAIMFWFEWLNIPGNFCSITVHSFGKLKIKTQGILCFYKLQDVCVGDGKLQQLFKANSTYFLTECKILCSTYNLSCELQKE